jgi:hypothetical protein
MNARPPSAVPRRVARARSGLLRLALAAFALVLALARTTDARADAFEVADSSWEGCSELYEIARAELGPARVAAVGVLNWSEVGPEDGVLALHPEQAMDPDETAAFMKAGGRLAILDDYGRGDETLARFHIERILAPAHPVLALRNKAALAIAEPVVDAAGGRGPHPVVAHVQRLATNHPTGLRHPNLSAVLRIRAVGESDVVIAVAGQVGTGRLFAMSDPSAVTNQMLRFPGNRTFAAALARYLVDDDAGHRQRGRLFIVANRFHEEGSFGGQTTLHKDLDAALRNAANALADARRDGLPRGLLLALAALAAIGVAGWVSRSSARPYRAPLPRYARPTPLVAQGGLAGRLGLLGAPSSPRSLALLELRSALFEAVAQRFGLTAEPPPDELAKLVRRNTALDDAGYSALKEVLAIMARTESALVAGRPAPVPRATLARAVEVVDDVLAACQAGGPSPSTRTAAQETDAA